MTLSFILLAYTGESVATTFLVTAGMFGALAALRNGDPAQSSGLGQFLFMGLIGVVLASIVGMFWQNDALQFVISFIGVIVFTGLAAYDAQRLKAMALALPSGQTGSYAIVGALALYLDFINLFLSCSASWAIAATEERNEHRAGDWYRSANGYASRRQSDSGPWRRGTWGMAERPGNARTKSPRCRWR